jgi:hypothetical protein
MRSVLMVPLLLSCLCVFIFPLSAVSQVATDVYLLPSEGGVGVQRTTLCANIP